MSANVPQLGFGTYRNDEYDQCKKSVQTALNVGYRHIDTAEAYRNEEAVGDAIESADVDPDEVYLTTKVLHPKFTDSYEASDIYSNGRACLDRLGVDSVDLFYGIHWPNGDPPAYDAVVEACERLYDENAFTSFGVCNLTPELIDEVQVATSLSIDALQVEMHPLLPQEELREYCEEEDITLVAYGPLGNERVLDVPELNEIAKKHGVSAASVCLAWLQERGVHSIPKATSEDHIRDNWTSLDLALDREELMTIDAINREERVYDPDYAPDW